MTEDDIAKLRALIPEDLTLPADLTPEEMLKLQMVHLQMAVAQLRELHVLNARIRAYLERAEAALTKLEEQSS